MIGLVEGTAMGILNLSLAKWVLQADNGLRALPSLWVRNVNSTQKVVPAERLRAGQENPLE